MTHPRCFPEDGQLLLLFPDCQDLTWECSVGLACVAAGGNVDTRFRQHPAEGEGLSREPRGESYFSPNLIKVLM